MSEDLNKLPRWAQQKIKTLEMRLAETTADLNALQNNTPSEISYSRLGSQQGYLLPYTHVRFHMDNEPKSFNYIEGFFTLDDGLYVNAGLGSLIVEPRATNAIVLKTKV